MSLLTRIPALPNSHLSTGEHRPERYMAGTDTIRAVVADDSHFVRTVVEGILEEHGVEVVGLARDGKEAVEHVGKHQPDVVTMDVEMPEMNGIEAVERIMGSTPTPILMLSAHTDENADVTFDALERGAVDVYTKPGGEVSTQLSGHDDRLVEAVRSVANADVSARSTGTDRTNTAGAADRSADSVTGAGPTAPTSATYVDRPTLLVAASTGGPSVVERILAEIPVETDFRVLVVQHMPSDFTDRFAARLDANTSFTFSEATDGARIGGGEGVVAAGGYHMEVGGYAAGRLRLKLTEDDPEHGVRPAANVTMRTAAATIDDPMVGVVLTGMGADGAEGVERLHEVGAHLIVQSEDSASVASMPRHAINTGVVDEVTPTEKIASAICTAITTQ